MSLICLCVTNKFSCDKFTTYKLFLESISKEHKRGLTFAINWQEPIADYLKNKKTIINLCDSSTSCNCETLLLPDGWYYNGIANTVPFNKKMEFLQDVADFLTNSNLHVEFYIGCSGAEPEYFADIVVKRQDLTEYLTSTIGQKGVQQDIHIIIGGNEKCRKILISYREKVFK